MRCPPDLTDALVQHARCAGAFATGYWLRRDAMQWFWDQYTTDPAQRAEITAWPLPAAPGDLVGLPPALIIRG